MAWLRSAMNKAAEVRGRTNFGEAVRSHTGYNMIRPGNAVAIGAKMLHDRIAAWNMRSYKEAVRMLEEVSVSSQGEERVQLLRRWLASLREIERLDSGSADYDEKYVEDPHTATYRNDSPGKSDVVLYYDQDLGVSPVNFRDVFLHSQALEGITVSMILGAPNEEEIVLLYELFGLCLTGGKEVHDVIVERILDLSNAFSVYDDEVLAKKRELLEFAQSAISGLKINADILRIDSEVSEIHQNLKRIEHQDLLVGNDGSYLDATNDATLEVIKESVLPVRLCCRLESLLLKKRLLNNGDTSEDHALKVDKLKVLSESLLSSASKTEKRISDHRQQKEEALHFRVTKTSEVSQIEKELAAEISVLEKQRDELETEMKKVNSSLAAVIARLENAREEREQFDDANNQLLVHFKSKDDELSKAIVSYRAEADTCSTFVDFLEATWSFQSSFMEHREKKAKDELEIHEEYFVNVTRSLLSSYKDALEPAINNMKQHMKNLKRYEKAIDPDEEFLQDIERRKALEHQYLAAESKVITIFDATESVKEQFYRGMDKVSRKGVEPVNNLYDAIGKIKVDFDSIPRPPLSSDKSTLGAHQMSSKEIPGKGAPPSSILVMPVDIKSILTQKLVTRSPNKKPYIPLGGSSENSPSYRNNDDDAMPLEREQELGSEDKKFLEPSTSEDKKMAEPSKELGSLALEKEFADPDNTEYEQGKTSAPSTSNDEKSLPSSTSQSHKTSDIDEEPPQSA
ncbi:hypothetical protein CTI12_AA220940 [Artemisia annua]|uniref:Uncharacterized protein n=1 Tax=Artemisia annua TaxID=35608 RepID=A0A2U1NWH5_ARTAN|nr:hypothetical protein CTI12_AA220940 [Artemisia annua]